MPELTGDVLRDLRHIVTTVTGMAEFVSEMHDNESALVSQVIVLNKTLDDLKPEVAKIAKIEKRGKRNRLLIVIGYTFPLFLILLGMNYVQGTRISSLCDAYKSSRNDILAYNRANIEYAQQNPGSSTVTDSAEFKRYQDFIESKLPERHC